MKHANSAELSTGLVAYATLTIGGLEVDATIRRTVGGRFFVAFPARRVDGRRVSLVRPVDQAARDVIEADALALLGLGPTRRRA